MSTLKYAMVLVALMCLFMATIPYECLSVPLCSQVKDNVEFFCLNNDPYCIPVIQWQGSCGGEDREWRCRWGICDDCPNYCYGSWNPCNCSGGGCDCLLEDTPVTMADGSTKPIKMIQKGDEVLAYDESSGKSKPSKVLRIHVPYTVKQYRVINDEIRLTENHPVLSEGQWVAAGDLRVGDTMTLANGSKAEIHSIVIFEDTATVYNIQVESGTYIANGVVVHNKEDCLEYQQACPGGC